MDVRRIWFEPELAAMVISNDLWFAAFNATDVLWRSQRISWDGMRNVVRQGLTVTGEAYDPTGGDRDWVPFSLDLKTGEVRGGSYNGPPM